MTIACRFAGRRGSSDSLVFLAERDRALTAPDPPNCSARLYRDRAEWSELRRSGHSVVASMTPEIVRCPGQVGSADRWAARINGRTVFVAARPGQLATGAAWDSAVRSGPSPRPATARGERGLVNFHVWSSIDCRLCHAPAQSCWSLRRAVVDV